MKNPKKQVSWKRTLYILFFAQVMVAVGFSSIYPFLPLYVEQLGSTTGMSIELLAGLIYSVQALTMMIASPFWGVVADRFGRKLMVVRSMYGGAIVIFLMTFASSAEQLVFLRALQGLLTGTLSAANALVASEVPRRESGYAMGLLQMGISVGTAVGPLVGGVVADTFGYSAVFYITALCLLLGGLTVTFGVHENFKPVRHEKGRKINLVSSWQSLLMLPGVFMVYVMRFITSMGRVMTIPIIPLFIKDLLSNSASVNTFTGLVIGVTSGATMISTVILGKLGDRTGYRRILVTAMMVLAVGFATEGYVTVGWQLLALQALVGMALGGVIPIISAILANYTKAGDEGLAFGLDNSVTAAGRGVAPLLGAAVAIAWGYPLTFVLTGLVFAVSTVLVVWKLPASRTATTDTSA
jgi:DHA1 family multidrug resistance protein-like MFS transporter